ncbi:MAG: hypothetical protein GF383_04280 [Candidatus Lokiarchaeota archaeon]|nr:hypothetical protein [Candidatus Lokiarchaeota archaeon]MBD3338975.1 hypothetical protein [Candidatus Lokiarchaeota archaeon]
MSIKNSITTLRGKRIRKNHKVMRKAFCLAIISIFLLSIVQINFINQLNTDQNPNYSNDSNKLNDKINFPFLSSEFEDLTQDPYTTNFSDIWKAVKNNFKSSLDYDRNLYVGETNSSGEIEDNNVYSLDNLLLYNSLLRQDYDGEKIIEAYLDLKDTPLYYEGNLSDNEFDYGFIESIDGTSGNIINTNRSLIDNLQPIFSLIENSGKEIESQVRNEVIESFELINSSAFWNDTDKGFYQYNSSTEEYKYYTLDNLYAILANLLIYQYSSEFPTIKDRAYELATETMNSLLNNMWDNTNLGFYLNAKSGWSGIGTQNRRKYLDVNALGIIVLLEFWKYDGLNNDSVYFLNATKLYERLNKPVLSTPGGLWNSSYDAFGYFALENWIGNLLLDQQKIDLESNAKMMYACLKFFEYTGNITYYNRAIDLYNSFEEHFYDTSADGYQTSKGSIIDPNINLQANLRLAESYYKAFEVYNSTIVDIYFNFTGAPDFIMNQDIINLTSNYKYKNIVTYPNGTIIDTIVYDNITDATINYIFRYPNATEIETLTDTITQNITRLFYPITDQLPFYDSYSIDVITNTSLFGFATSSITFNVISGLVNGTIAGLDDDTFLYQAQTINITLPITSNYNYNLTLNITLEAEGLSSEPLINITFNNNTQTKVALNITADFDTEPGLKIFHIIFTNASVTYLDVIAEIEVENALSYGNLIYDGEVVEGNFISISLKAINFLPNNSQSFNLLFSGDYILNQNNSINLDENEEKLLNFNVLAITGIVDDQIEIDMGIYKGNTMIYSEILYIDILQPFELISIEFPEKITQGVTPTLTITIQNNQDYNEEYSLIINGDDVDPELEELVPGRNKIEYKIIRLWNPYEIGEKQHEIEIEDSSENTIIKEYIEYEVQLSSFNLVFFYLIPIIIPIAVILIYKNKDIKNKLLRR